MKNALQDQLLKAGLATEEQFKKASAKPRRPPPKNKNKKPKKTTNKKPHNHNSDLKRAYDARKKLEAAEKHKKEQLAAQRKANRRKIRLLVSNNTLNKPDAEISYRFIIGQNIKNVYVTEEQQKQLLSGKLAITFFDGRRCIIPRSIADEIMQLDPKKAIVIQPSDIETPRDENNEHEYSSFKVPEDLQW
jgi:uncharacterized protein YaiL (DUF2058 family)